MEKKILIPTNFSKHSWNALIFAMNLYKKFSCTFYLVNSYSSQRFSDNMPLGKKDQEEPNNKEISESGLERFMQGLSFRKENSNHRFEMISHQGSLVNAIQENADKFGVDIIILGSRGDSVHINTSEDISKITEDVEQCPILIIPETYEWSEKINAEIVFPTNLRIPFKQKELLALIDFSRSLGAAVRVLYINSDSKKLNPTQITNKKELEIHLTNVTNSFHVLTQTTPATGVHLFIESRESNFLALYQRKQGFFSRLFSKSVVSEIAFDPKLPVLVLKEVK